MGTEIRSAFPGTVSPGTDDAVTLAQQARARAGVVYITDRPDTAEIEAEVRIVGTQISGIVLVDDVTTRYRIVLRDALAEPEIQADVIVGDDMMRLRTAIALAEGMARGLARSVGVDLIDFTPEG